MVKSRVTKGTGVLLQQLLDMTESHTIMVLAVTHDYSAKTPNIALKNAYNLFQTRKTAFNKQVKKLKEELTDKEYADVEALLSGNFDDVKDHSSLNNYYSSPAYKGEVKGWRDIFKWQLLTVIGDDYKLKGVGGAKFVNNDKYISALKERLENPVKLKEKVVKFEEDSGISSDYQGAKADTVEDEGTTTLASPRMRGAKKKPSGGAKEKETVLVNGRVIELEDSHFRVYGTMFDGSETSADIDKLTEEQSVLLEELMVAYFLRPDAKYNELIKLPKYRNWINIDALERNYLDKAYERRKFLRMNPLAKDNYRWESEIKEMRGGKAFLEDGKEIQEAEDAREAKEGVGGGISIEDAPNPEVVDDPDAPYLPVGEGDTDTVTTSNTKHQDGANSEFTLGDATILGGATPLNTPEGSAYSTPVEVGSMDINELRARLQSQPTEEVAKAVKTGVFQGFGTVPEVVVEEVSRTGGEMPTNPQEAVNMATGNEVAEEKARNKKDIERLKEEIRGLHKTFDVLIPALREKPHQLRFKSAMSSKDKKVVMKHHAEMLERVRLYFGGGTGNNLKVGVVVPLDAYMSSFFSGVNNGEGEISNITPHTQPKGEQHARGSGGKIVAKSIYYQRGGMSAVKGQGVSGHQVPSTLIKTRRGKVADPLQVVDAPYEYVLNRKGASSRPVAGLKIKSKK